MIQRELSEIFEFVRNGKSIKQNDSKSGYPITRIETIWNKTIDINRLGYADIFDRDLVEYEKYLMKKGDLLMTHINSPKHLGKCALYQGVPERLIHGMNLLCLRANQKISDPKYLVYYFNSQLFKNQLVKISNQSVNQASFSAGNLKKLKIPLPPLPQQKKIAAILDAADAYRQKTKALIAKYEELTQSLFLDMFGDPVTNPMGWEYVILDECLDFITSGSRGWAKYYSNEGVIFLRIQNIGYNELRLDDLNYVDAPESSESKRTRVYPGDMLLSITADLGRTGVIPEGFPAANINQHLALLRLKKSINPIFVSSYISSSGGQSMFLKFNKGGVKAGLNFKDIKSYRIFKVSLVLQDQFENKLKRIEEQKEKVKTSLKKSENLFNSLLQKAFKGELI